jgi:hypothetical protein
LAKKANGSENLTSVTKSNNNKGQDLGCVDKENILRKKKENNFLFISQSWGGHSLYILGNTSNK